LRITHTWLGDFNGAVDVPRTVFVIFESGLVITLLSPPYELEMEGKVRDPIIFNSRDLASPDATLLHEA
jgi:hypothetical protein